MYLQLSKAQAQRLAQLVRERIHELHPEIRRSMDTHFKERLREDLHELEGLLHTLQESDCDVLS